MFHVKHPADKLALYAKLVAKYHATLDLLSPTGLKNLDEKIADSLRYAEALAVHSLGTTVLDVGSGNGLPALPAAVALPHFTFHLVERRQRRATFLNIAKGQLGLDNIQVHARPVESVAHLRVDSVTAMAVGTFSDLYCLSRHLHGTSILLLSRKGPNYSEEVRQLESTLNCTAAEVHATPLSTNGTLVAVKLAGGKVCRL